MSKFNSRAASSSVNDYGRTDAQVTNLAGGKGFEKDPKSALAGLLLTSFAEDRHYESANDQINRLVSLVDQVEPLFAAKAAVFARDEFGMRSITHLTAKALGSKLFPEKRAFYRNVVVRPDDVLEIIAQFTDETGKLSNRLPNAICRGFADRLAAYDESSLMKYRSLNSKVTMYDAINLVHAHSEAIDRFMNGQSQLADTWENALSNKVDESNTKADVWATLVLENKLGIFALLRNLRNLVESGALAMPGVLDAVCDQLTNENAVSRSRLFPYRFLAAYRIFVSAPSAYGARTYLRSAKAPQKLLDAINKAAEISLVNVPTLPGSSAILLDVSGSMESQLSGNSVMSVLDAGAMLGAMLYKKNPDCELIQFGDTARMLRVNASMPLLEIAQIFATNPGIGHGTSMSAGIDMISGKHDRVMIISDMQTWNDDETIPTGLYRGTYNFGVKPALNRYVVRAGVKPYFYEISVCDYGQSVLDGNNSRVFHLASLSDKIFLIMNGLEAGTASLVETIENTSIT
jgi:60 kDa SS-A/Ro ribonucleoprotein